MIKQVSILLLVLFFSFKLHAQFTITVQWTEQTSLPAADIIYYNPSVKLEWKDFKGSPVQYGRTAAVTMSGFGYSASVKALRNTGKLDISVYCFFDKNKSWVKPGNKTSYILTHEQHHFDLSYLAAHKFINRIMKTKLTLANYDSILKQLYNESIDDMNKMQDAYDNHTRNGQDEKLQEKWNNLIDGRIASATE